MKKTLLLTSMLLGIHSAANAKNELFVGASFNSSKDKYSINKSHGQNAAMKLFSWEINDRETSIAAWQYKIDQINFSLDNKDLLDPYYLNLGLLQYVNYDDSVAFYHSTMNNPALTFEQKKQKIQDFINFQGSALMQLALSPVNPVGAELHGMVVTPGARPQAFYQPFLLQAIQATTENDLINVITGYHDASSSILIFVGENTPPSYFQNELASIYGAAGFDVVGLEMLTPEEFANMTLFLNSYSSLMENWQENLDAMLAYKQNVMNELNSIKSEVSERNNTISLFAGFRKDVAKHFMLGFEAGVDLGKISIGDNAKKELEITGKTGLYGVVRMGVNLNSSVSIYAQAGLMQRKYDMSYNGVFVKENIENQTIVSSIYGLGVEGRIVNNLAMFVEYNHITSGDKLQTRFIEASVKSQQIKIGSRYYFGL